MGAYFCFSLCVRDSVSWQIIVRMHVYLSDLVCGHVKVVVYIVCVCVCVRACEYIFSYF